MKLRSGIKTALVNMFGVPAEKEGVFLLKFKLLFLIFMIILGPFVALAQPKEKQQKQDIYVVIEDTKGEKLEGYLRFSPEELLVSTKDNQEKSVPLKQIEFIRLEKISGGVPGAEQPGTEAYYSVQLQNSQEIFTLRKKYTFSLSTSLGIVTKTIDPGVVQDLFRKDSSSGIRDRGAVFSLEFKF
jgi:hypothetical protein